MAKKSPKRQPQPPEGETTNAPPKDRPAPITVKKPLPPDAVKRMREFYKDSLEIERQLWRLTN